jgi:hypothetical protein
MKRIIIYSTVFVIFGTILVSGTLYVVPYTVIEPIRVDRSKTWVDDTFTLSPHHNISYYLDSVIKNTSIFQVDIGSSVHILFRIINDDENMLVFEWQKGGTLFWTPPSPGYDIWLFVFHNPSSASVNVTARVTEFYLKITEYRNVEYYRSLLDHLYGYIGIIAIIAGTAINVVHVSREAKRQK